MEAAGAEAGAAAWGRHQVDCPARNQVQNGAVAHEPASHHRRHLVHSALQHAAAGARQRPWPTQPRRRGACMHTEGEAERGEGPGEGAPRLALPFLHSPRLSAFITHPRHRPPPRPRQSRHAGGRVGSGRVALEPVAAVGVAELEDPLEVASCWRVQRPPVVLCLVSEARWRWEEATAWAISPCSRDIPAGKAGGKAIPRLWLCLEC